MNETFELEYYFFREKNKLMVTLSVWGDDAKRREYKILQFDETAVKDYIEELKDKYPELSRTEWSKILKEKESFLVKELHTLRNVNL